MENKWKSANSQKKLKASNRIDGIANGIDEFFRSGHPNDIVQCDGSPFAKRKMCYKIIEKK